MKTNNEENQTNNDENTSEIIIYADDNTPTTTAVDPRDLEDKIQRDSDTVIDWFDNNDMVTSSDKTKLLVIGTKQNRLSKLENKNIQLQVTVNEEVKTETSSEKLLGVVVNNCLNFKNHLFGNDDEIGLVKNFSKRIGIFTV